MIGVVECYYRSNPTGQDEVWGGHFLFFNVFTPYKEKDFM